MAAPSNVSAQNQNSVQPAVVSIPPEFDAVLRAYEEAWGRRDADALANLFTEDGFVLSSGRDPVQGREAIRSAYANSGGSLTLVAYGSAMDGSVGYIVGGFALAPNDPMVGKFVLTLRRTPSGHWLIAADMENVNRRW